MIENMRTTSSQSLTPYLNERERERANSSIIDRSETITKIKNEMFFRAKQIDLSEISLMVYGSSSYNFYSGKAEDEHPHIDFDGIGIISDDDMPYDRFIHIVQHLFAKRNLPTELVYNQLISGEIGILMIKGEIEEQEVNIHFISKKTVKRLLSGKGNQSTQTLFRKTMSTFKVLYRGYYLNNGEVADSMAEAKTYEVDDKYWSVKDPISRKSHDNGHIVKDILADKFLSATVIWDPSDIAIWASKRIWTNYVRASLYYNPSFTDEDILNMIHRAERFSPMFRQKLLRRIRKEREILSRRILRIPYSQESNSYMMSLYFDPNSQSAESQHLYESEVERYLNLMHHVGIDIYELNGATGDQQTTINESLIGDEFVATATEVSVVDFYRDVILKNIFLLVQAQPDSDQLKFTMNPSPSAFIFENDVWLYKNAHPPLTIQSFKDRKPDIFNKVKIWKECIIEMSKQKPDKFPLFYSETLRFLKSRKMHREELYIQEYF